MNYECSDTVIAEVEVADVREIQLQTHSWGWDMMLGICNRKAVTRERERERKRAWVGTRDIARYQKRSKPSRESKGG